MTSIKIFLTMLLKFIKKINPDSDIILNYINSTLTEYENIKTGSLSSYLSLIFQYMTNDNIYHFNDIIKSLKNTNYEPLVKKRINSITNFSNLSLYSIFYGNINGHNLPDTRIY